MNPPPNLPAADEESLFARALALPADARAAFLAEACAGDPARRRRLEALLRAAARSPEFLEQPHTEVAAAPPPSVSEGPGARVGRYKLLQQIGEGGCGTVFMAEQEEPVRRRVALKVIKLGMDTRSVVARFEAERQALALMDHPNIAKVLDAGATDSGRPFFVMELVRGIPITRYCDENKLDTKARLDLFIRVCQAVQHAHQKGIIHRDLKPSNILVTLHDGVPVPKVIDFGIAKATEGRLTDATVYTQLHQFIGTPAYMSPEQAEMSGLDIDTRSDIYSLGVLLYELLTGRTPFDAKELAQAGLDEIRRRIREVEPPRPSTRLSTLLVGDDVRSLKPNDPQTEEVRASIRRLLQELKGDLDWIVMKCLEKDRARRYDTANGLAADLKRHLNNEPVTARPPSAAYRFQKAFRRNKLAFAAGAAVVLALLLGVLGTTLALLRTRAAEALAIRSRGEAEKLSSFMLDEFHDELQPRGRYETMARLAQQTLDYYERLPRSLRTSTTDLHRLTAQARLATIRVHQGQFKVGEALAKEATAGLERLREQGDSSEGLAYALSIALSATSQYHDYAGDIAAASIPIHRAMEILRPHVTSGTTSRRTRLQYAFILGWVSHAQPAAEQSVLTCDEALQLLAAMGALDLSDPEAAILWADTADSKARHLFALGRFEEAAALEHRGLDLATRTTAQDPSNLASRRALWFATELLGLIDARNNREATALEWFRKSEQFAADYLRLNPSDSKGSHYEAVNAYCIAALLLRRGEVRKALETARTGARRASATRLAEHAWGGLWTLVAMVEAQREDPPAALEGLRQGQRSIEELMGSLGSTDQARAFWMEALHHAERQVQMSFGNYPEALNSAMESLRRIEELVRNERDGQNLAILNQRKRQALAVSALATLELDRPAEAEASARALLALPLLRTSLSERILIAQPDDPVRARVLLAEAQLKQGRVAEALESIEPAVAYYREQRVQGAQAVIFRQHLAHALLVQARAQPATAAGEARRWDSLTEALQLLRSLSPEAQRLKNSADLLTKVEAEQNSEPFLTPTPGSSLGNTP
jgi:serine/threonine protein kinase